MTQPPGLRCVSLKRGPAAAETDFPFSIPAIRTLPPLDFYEDAARVHGLSRRRTAMVQLTSLAPAEPAPAAVDRERVPEGTS